MFHITDNNDNNRKTGNTFLYQYAALNTEPEGFRSVFFVLCTWNFRFQKFERKRVVLSCCQRAMVSLMRLVGIHDFHIKTHDFNNQVMRRLSLKRETRCLLSCRVIRLTYTSVLL